VQAEVLVLDAAERARIQRPADSGFLTAVAGEFQRYARPRQGFPAFRTDRHRATFAKLDEITHHLRRALVRADLTRALDTQLHVPAEFTNKVIFRGLPKKQADALKLTLGIPEQYKRSEAAAKLGVLKDEFNSLLVKGLMTARPQIEHLWQDMTDALG
jgi:hypothetical protein